MARHMHLGSDYRAAAGIVDIHSHLLPGIDDGPDDLDGALALARAAASSGVCTLAATPHLRADFPAVRADELADRCEAMREAIRREGIVLEIVSGAELSLSWALEAKPEELALASYGQRGRDLLIETPTSVFGLDDLLFELRLKGFRITLAHPERNPDFQQDPTRLERLVEQEVLLQVNADALVSKRHSPVGALAEGLCLRGFAHILASDGHRASSWRPVTQLAEAVKAASKLVGEARARWMTSTAPAAIVAGTDLPEPPGVKKQRGWRRVLR